MTSPRIDYGKVAPGVVKSMYATNAYLDECSIGQALRRFVELRVSQINGCTYCTWLHARQARDLGEPEARISAVAQWRSADCFDDAERCALEWSEAVTRITDGTPPDAMFDVLRRHFDDRQIVELTAVASNMNALNRMGISFRLEPPANE